MTGLNETKIREVVARVLNGIAPEIDLDSIDPSRNLRDQMDIDSVDLREAYRWATKELGVEIPDGDLSKLATLNSCVGYLASKVKQA